MTRRGVARRGAACVNVARFYFTFHVRDRARRWWEALPSISSRTDCERDSNKYSTTLADRARDFFPSLRKN